MRTPIVTAPRPLHWRSLCHAMLLALCLLTPSLAAQAAPAPLCWAQLADPQGALSIHDAARASFKEASGQPALGYRAGATWLRLQLPALRGEHYGWLELRSSLLDNVAFYQQGADGHWQVQRAGDRIPLAAHTLNYRQPVFRVNWQNGQPATVYLRLESTSTLSFPWALHTPSSFMSSAGREQLLFGVFYAIHLVLLVSSTWFWLRTRNLTFALFGLCVLANLISTLCAEGHAYQYLLPDQPRLSDALYVVSWFGATPLGMLFSCHYLGLYAGRWRRAALGATWLAAAIALITAPWLIWSNISWLRPAYLLWALSANLLLLLASLWQLVQGNCFARPLALVQVLFLGGIGVRLARNTGLVEPGWLVDNAHYLGMMAFFLIMHSVVTWRYTDLRAEKEAAQAEALRVAREAEQRLEQQVAERTEALKEAMEQVEGALLLERRAQQQQQQFLATVSHELRTPLAVIDSAAQNLLLGTGDAQAVGERTRQRYQKILAASQRLTLLLHDALSDTRFTLARQRVEAIECSPAALLEDAARSAAIVSDTHRIVVDTGKLPDIWVCDPALTTLALRTLTDNAVKYTPPGCEIRLGGQLEGDTLLLCIRDNGPGIRPDELPRLFEHGFRGSESARHAGSGQGLPLARQMLAWQGGSLSVDNQEGGGCRACLRLPRRTAEAQPSATETVSA
ncbi:sensor histidine kinase [Crenobacter intestini]|uniref:histidine kinase n=1 Tax=Crenobacter intestini TaxID=2563443 RepID=A0A4V4N6Y0_9NEIS|nr:sensor histidine kinase [Crenobacter intestini]TIC78473.1 histidine kinase [Crenobacter intestini]